MFMDYILESETGYSYGVSQETMDEVDNIEIPSLSACAGMSPFEIMSKANYEFALENTDMFKAVARAEMNYIRENGTEPIWEGADVKGILDKFISAVKSLIGKITAAFGKLLKSIDAKVQSIYNKYAGKLDTKINNAKGDSWADKKLTIRKYNPSIGEAILNQDPMSTMNKVTGFKHVQKLLDNPDAFGKGSEKTLGDSDMAKGLVSQINEAIFGGKLSSGVDYSSTSSIKSALYKAMVSNPVDVDWIEAREEIQYFVRDPKANSMKAELKKRYNEIKKNLGKCIDDAKKNAKKAERSTGKGSAVGVYTNALNKYIQTMHSVYQVTSKCITGKWFQSARIYIMLSNSIRKSNSEFNKNERKADREAKKDLKKMTKESFSFSFE